MSTKSMQHHTEVAREPYHVWLYICCNPRLCQGFCSALVAFHGTTGHAGTSPARFCIHLGAMNGKKLVLGKLLGNDGIMGMSRGSYSGYTCTLRVVAVYVEVVQ